MISKADWHSWKTHPVTKVYRELIEEAMRDVEFIVHLDSLDKTALEAAHNVGIRRGLTEALEMEPEEFYEDLEGRD